MTDRHAPVPAADSPAGTPEATTTTVEVAGRPVRIRRSGPAQAPPVVLLHGHPGSLTAALVRFRAG